MIHATCGRRHRPFTPCPPPADEGATSAPLTPDQLNGIACLGCSGTEGAMRPVGTIDGCQVFVHDGCADVAPKEET